MVLCMRGGGWTVPSSTPQPTSSYGEISEDIAVSRLIHYLFNEEKLEKKIGEEEKKGDGIDPCAS